MTKSIGIALAAVLVIAVAPSSGRAESFVLSGLVLSDGGNGVAYLQEPSLTNNEVVSVRRGDSVGPYRLTRILEDRVEMEGPTGTVLIPLSGASGSAVASGTPAASTRSVANVRVENAPPAAAPPSTLGAAPVAAAMRERIKEFQKLAAEVKQNPAKFAPPPPPARQPAAQPTIIYPTSGDPSKVQGLNSFLGPLLGPR